MAGGLLQPAQNAGFAMTITRNRVFANTVIGKELHIKAFRNLAIS
jgi:hypothetical protein